jgi:hypothetical protein
MLDFMSATRWSHWTDKRAISLTLTFNIVAGHAAPGQGAQAMFDKPFGALQNEGSEHFQKFYGELA